MQSTDSVFGRSIMEIGQKTWGDLAPAVSVLARDYDPPCASGDRWHWHEVQQLVFCLDGAADLHLRNGVRKLDADHAVLIPPKVSHRLVARSRHPIGCIYSAAGNLPLDVQKIPMSSLMIEMYRTIIDHADEVSSNTAFRLTALCLHEFLGLNTMQPLNLTWPHDPRLARICKFIRDRPDDRTAVEVLGVRFGLSPRSLLRLSNLPFGYSLHEWRRRWRVLQSIELLRKGAPLSSVGHEVGYLSHSAYVAAFKSYTGMPPSAFLRDLKLK